MLYNKTKRGLEMGAGIVAMIAGLTIVGYCIYLAVVFTWPWVANGYYQYTYMLVIEILLIVFGILQFFLALCLIPSPVKKNGEVEDRTFSRIVLLVSCFLSGNLISAGLLIAVLCLKDYKNDESFKTEKTASSEFSIENKITELKHLKELGVIDDEQYKKAIEKIITNIV